jgi:RHH-type rel operon transcriptional repressor/antitoxin RelB
MLSVRLPKEMEERIERLAQMTRRPKSFFVREALSNYLEDMEDYYLALKRQNDPSRNLITLDELEQALELQDSDR